MDRSPVAISVEGLSVRYPGRWRRPPVDALIDLELSVEPGEIVGILGPNGSGKTTLLEVLCGNLRPSSGRARVLDRPPGDRGLVRELGYQPEGPLPFPHLEAAEFLAYLGSLMGVASAELDRRAAELCSRLRIASVRDRPVHTLSTGVKRRLALVASLLAEPRALLLDEPTSGLDPLGSLLVMELLEELAAEGCAVLMASHHLQEIEQVCGRVCVLDCGKKVAEGSLDELLGTGEELLRVRGLDPEGRHSVEQAAILAGGEVIGWRPDRRHLFSLFRKFEP